MSLIIVIYQRTPLPTLSRIPQRQPKIATVKLGHQRSRNWADAQSKDPYISLIYDRLTHGTEKPSGKEMEGRSLDTRTLWSQWSNLSVKDYISVSETIQRRG